MTVQAQDSVQYYDGPINVGAVIPITDFTFIDNSHVSLKIRGIDEIWEYGTDYTVDGADTLTRTITLNRAVEAGQVLAAYLDVPITQNISPEEGGNFPASTNEFVLDKLTYICQMLYERITRALQVSVDTPFNGTLPDPEGKANRIIALNSTGTGLAYSTYDVSELEYIANRLYASIDNVDITANNIEDVITTAANILGINTVAGAIQSVITTAESITNVNIVGDDLALGIDSAINKVNANKENIDINAANIEDIQNAEENAQTCIDKALEAATSANRANTNANNATIWAEGTDEQVETLGGQHSAKGWAEVASQGQIQSDWEQEDATKKDYIKNKPNLHTGYFPGVHVGLADNLYDASAPVDISSFWFRTSAGEESITTGPAALRALRGNMLNSGYTPRSGNYTTSSGITVNNFDLDVFEANNPSTGTYVFQYNRPNWTLNGSVVTPGSWGLDVTPRSEALSIITTGEIAASCTDVSIFAAAIGGDTGSYIFTFVNYEGTETHIGPYWTYNGEEIDLIDYALSVTGEPVNGDSITVNYIAPLLTGTVTVEYIKEVLGALIPAAVDYLFATVSMNQYDKNGIGRLTHIINNATIDNTGKIVSGTGKVACVRAVGGIYSGYVAYSENQYITRIAHTPLVWNSGAAILPVIGDMLSLEDTIQDAELSVALFDPVSWVCVAVTDDSDLSIHPRWSSGQDQDHTYDEYFDNRVEIPKVDKNGVDLPTGLYGMPAIGTVFDEIRFENVNTYIKRIERVVNTVDNMAMVQAYGTPYLYDSDYIFYILKDVDITVYELGDVPDDYIANDYGTEALVATTPDNMCTLNISYGTNLKDKLRTNVLTISQQDLTAAQQEQVRTNIGISNSANLFDFKWTDHLLNSPNYLRADTFSWHDGTAYSIAYNELLSEYNAATEAEYNYNITTVGNLIKDNGVLSGFSLSNYAQLPNSVSLGSNFEIVVKFRTGSDATLNSILIRSDQKIACFGITSDSVFGYNIGDGSSWLVGTNNKGNHIVQSNTTYYGKLTYNGSVYKAYISTDSENWEEDWSFTSSNIVPSAVIDIGLNTTNTTNPWLGSIDLKESYININNQRWWTGAEVRYKVSPKGYKIAPAAQEQTVLNAYNDTGIAWYYILDTENTRFKLPRTKWGFKGLRDSVGAPIASGLPDHTHTRGTMNITGNFGNPLFGFGASDNSSGAVVGNIENPSGRSVNSSSEAWRTYNKRIDASRSWTGSTSTPNYSYTTQRLSQVQEPGTQMYLYFYIGENTQSALYNTAGLSAELFNGKLDLNASNLSAQGMRYIAGMGMPSNKKISLTLGASGSSYTAPANGWFCIRKGTASTNQYIAIGSSQSQICSKCISPTSSNEVYVNIPVLKNQTVWITYNASGSTNLFCFIYAQGSESEVS